MNDAQRETWDKIVGFVDSGKLKAASYEETEHRDYIKISIDDGFEEWWLHPDGSLSTQVKVTKSGMMTRNRYDPEFPNAIAAKVCDKAKEIGLIYDKVHIQAHIYGRKHWRLD